MIDETWYTRPPGIRERRGAGGVVVRWERERLLIALVRGDGLSDLLLPKGGVEADETDEEAARREIEEEAGLTDLELLDDLGTQERLSYVRTRWQVTRYFLFLTTETVGAPTDTTHDYAVEWHPIDTLPRMFWPEQRRLIEVNLMRIRTAAKAAAGRKP
jgi:8-oxo-dGTP pyrophosphatase MutT (NUDIX family)